MDVYGYPKMTPAKAVITPEVIKKAKEESGIIDTLFVFVFACMCAFC